eukprot:1969392-Pyramimonas_sp.AAC.1
MQVSTRASSVSMVGACGSKGSSQEALSTQAARSASHFPLRTPMTDAVSATRAGCIGSPSSAK